MNIIGISINHRTAPVQTREELHLSKEESIQLISKLKNGILKTGFVLSTCNRTEVFGIPIKEEFVSDKLIEALKAVKPNNHITNDQFGKYFSCSAVKHIFSVTTGVDSMITGDSQILAQSKDSFQLSEEVNFSDSVLRRFFDTAIRAGKRAIKETAIGEGAVSVSYAAVQVIEKIFAVLQNKSALVIGAGETGELAAINLRDKGVGSITLCNRTLQKGKDVAKKIGADVLPFENLSESLNKFDVIISATSSNDYLLGFEDFNRAMKKRRGTPIVVMDVAVPRDIDPAISGLDSVFYNDIDSLQKIVDSNLQKRKDEIPLVNEIILEEMEAFYSWFNTLEVVPTIKSLRDFCEDIRLDELNKIKHKVIDDDFVKLEDMTRRLIGRILHNPTIKLREIAEKGDFGNDVVSKSLVIKELFGLENNLENKDDFNEED